MVRNIAIASFIPTLVFHTVVERYESSLCASERRLAHLRLGISLHFLG